MTHDPASVTVLRGRALSFLEDHAAFSRTGRGGIFQVDTRGFAAAAFTHQTSRAGDPQLHTHVLVANKVLCGDGRWRSLDGREMFAFQKAAGKMGKAQQDLDQDQGEQAEQDEDEALADLDEAQDEVQQARRDA